MRTRRPLTAIAIVVGLTAGVLLVGAPTGAGAASQSAPTPTGQLKISGVLQDGSTVSATGVSWTPAPCQNGVCSVALTVSYVWTSCQGTSCHPPAIPPVQPYLPDLLLGAADAGRTLKVVETATDVRADGSTQTGRVMTSTATPVAAWPAGTAPRVDLVDGVPEATTSSTQERFNLSTPHANNADGSVTVSCALDGGAFSTGCAGPRSYLTPGLAVGAHTLQVRAANAAGSTTASDSWTVSAPSAPAGCASCFHPPHLDSTGIPMTWDWQLSNSGTHLVYRNVDMLDIDGFDNTGGAVSTIHARAGRTLAKEVAICYISLGSWENFRSDAASWPDAPLGLTLGGYPNEHWVDVRQLSSLTPIIDSRLQMCASKGFDGVEVDNIDGWTNHTGFPLTKADTEAWLATIANRTHAHNMFVLYKNDPYSTSFGVNYFDGALSEQCYAFQECTPTQENGFMGCNLTSNRCGVQVFADAGKWVGEVEYPSGVCTPTQTCTGSRNFTTYCDTTWKLQPAGYGLAAWRADLNLDGQTFFPCWPG